jgi:prepilin-type N-terminal cleavage/methylation domain-containing protein
MNIAAKPRRMRTDESGFTLVEMLLVISLMGLISGVIATAFVVSSRGSEKVRVVLPAARAANALSFWLASDISSAVPVNSTTWLNTGSATAAGCSSSPAGTTNVLRIETRNPISNTPTYVASYRYEAPVGPPYAAGATGKLWRLFCQSGAAPSSSSVVVDDIDPLTPPIGCGDTTACSGAAVQVAAGLALNVSSRGIVTPVSARAAVRVPATAPPIATIAPTTLVPKPACRYTAGTVGTGKKSVAGNKPLDAPVAVNITSNLSSGAGCTALLVKLPLNGNSECVLTRVGVTDVWTGSCFGSPITFPNNPATPQSVLVFDRVDPGDTTVTPTIPPTDVAVSGTPTLSLTITP